MRSIASKLALLVCLSVAAFGQTQTNLDTQTKGSRLPSWGTDSGTANSYVVATIAPAGPTLRTGSRYMFVVGHTNTGASTLTADGINHSVKKNISTALAAGDWTIGQVVEVVFDGTNFQWISAGTLTSLGSVACSQLPALTGDATTSAGSCATTVGKVNGVTYPTDTATNVVPVKTSSGAVTYEAVPNAALANSSVTVNGTTCTLGSSCSPVGGSGTVVTCPGAPTGTTCQVWTLLNNAAGTSAGKVAELGGGGPNDNTYKTVTLADAAAIGAPLAGICVSDGSANFPGTCTTSGTAEFAFSGVAMCNFPTSTTRGHSVFVDKTTTAGNCLDSGVYPANENPGAHLWIGTVHSTCGSAGLCAVDLVPNTQAGFEELSTLSGVIPFQLGQGGSPFSFPSTSLVQLDKTLHGPLGVLGIARHFDLSNFANYFDIFSNGNGAGSHDAEIDLSGLNGSHGALRIACENTGLGCANSHPASHYSPPDTEASVSGSSAYNEASADVRNWTLTGNTTISSFTFVNPGHISWWHICEDGTGGWAFTASMFINLPTIVSTASACTDFTAMAIDATHLYVLSGGSGGGISTPVSIANGGTGTGSTLTGLVRGNASAMTAAELSGDCATSGSNSVTCTKVNGNSVPSGAAAHQLLVGTAANTFSLKTLPDCTDTGGNHLNYTQSTDAFSCGTSGGGGTTTITTYLPLDQCTAAQSTNAGNSFWTVIGLTNWDAGHWELKLNTNADIYCSVRVPHAVAGTPNASWVIDPSSADVTNAHTAALSTCDAITTSLNLQVGSLSCAGSQNYSSTTTAYSSTELSFTVQATVAADQILVVKIHQASGGANTSNIVMPPAKLKIDQSL